MTERNQELMQELATEHALLLSMQREQHRTFIDTSVSVVDEKKEKFHAANLAGIILRHISPHTVKVNHERGFASTEIDDFTVYDIHEFVTRYFDSGLVKVERQRNRVIVRINGHCIHGNWRYGDFRSEWHEMANEFSAEQDFEHIEFLRFEGICSSAELIQMEDKAFNTYTYSRELSKERLSEIQQSVKERFAKRRTV